MKTTKEKIERAALKLFVEGGLATTTAQITKYAGVSTGVLFNYYSTKEELILELYSKIHKESMESIEQMRLPDQFKDVQSFEEERKNVMRKAIMWRYENWEKQQFLMLIENTPYMINKYYIREQPEVKRIDTLIMSEAEDAVGRGFFKGSYIKERINITNAIANEAVRCLHNSLDNDNDRYQFIEQTIELCLHIAR